MALILLFSLVSAGVGAATRQQQFQLVEGWNSIYLDVEPLDDRIEASIDQGLVDVVARYFVPPTAVRFIEDSNEQPWNVEGWSVWYSPRKAESFLNNLHALQGGAAYLVHAVRDGTLTVTGNVTLRRVQWKTESFNLTGFPVETRGMTFAEYFAGSGNRIGSKVYRLVKGNWQKVTNLATTQIQPGEACWVYCDGSTDYAGPLELKLNGSGGIDFNGVVSLGTVDLRNRANTPFAVTASIEGNTGLPLFRRIVDLGQLEVASTPATGLMQLGTIQPDALSLFRLEMRREQFSGTSGSAILKFSTSNGLVLRVPVQFSAE